MISVVMATYNGEKFIEEQLLSIYNQTRRPDEVVISDDGSTDATVRIINEFIDKYKLDNWKLYFHSANTKNNKNDNGPVKATRNFVSAFEKVSGDIIFFSDQDDIWDTRRVEVVAGIMEENTEIYALHCNKGYIDTKGCLLKSDALRACEKGFEKGSLTKISTLSNRFNPWLAWGLCMAVRKSVITDFLEIMNFPPPLDYMYHDYGCAYIASAYDEYYFYNEDLVFHRRHDENLSSANISRNIRDDAERQNAYRMMIVYLSFVLKLFDYMSTEKPFIKEKVFANNLKKICELRLKNHQNKRFFSTLLMLWYVPRYITFKGYLGDIIYLLGVEKHFKLKG